MLHLDNKMWLLIDTKFVQTKMHKCSLTVARPTQPEKIALKEDLGWPASPTLKLFSTAILQILFKGFVTGF